MKFRKKAVVIEAERYDGTEKSVAGFLNRGYKAPFTNPYVVYKAGGGECLITTPEGVMKAVAGDWIICGVKGELYPCKPDIFEATYDPVLDDEPLLAIGSADVNAAYARICATVGREYLVHGDGLAIEPSGVLSGYRLPISGGVRFRFEATLTEAEATAVVKALTGLRSA